jgi:hypothetical protein
MQVVIDLEIEQVCRLVFAELQETRDQFMEDLECESPSIFSCNPAYDKAQILKHIDALDVILDWYREP